MSSFVRSWSFGNEPAQKVLFPRLSPFSSEELALSLVAGSARENTALHLPPWQSREGCSAASATAFRGSALPYLEDPCML